MNGKKLYCRYLKILKNAKVCFCTKVSIGDIYTETSSDKDDSDDDQWWAVVNY